MAGPGTEMHFDKTDQKTWLAEIAREIGEPALENLNFIVDSGWGVSPFVHTDDIELTTSIRGGAEGLKWKILECFGSQPENNQVILTSLQGGCESLFFESAELTAAQLSVLLKGVHPEMVEIHFQSEDADQLRDLVSALKQWAKPEDQNRKNFRGGIRWLDPEPRGPSELMALMGHVQQVQDSFPAMKSVCWNFPFAEYENGFSAPMAQSFARIVSTLDQIDDPVVCRKVLQNSVVRVTIGQDYFREIIRLRAIRLLWYNLLQAHGLEGYHMIMEVHFHPGHYASDTEKNMIKAGTMALSAILGGADAVFILPADGNATTMDTRLRRIARNIHHLFRYESHLEKHSDPVRGAYFFESVVPELVRRVWKMSLGQLSGK